MSNRISGILLVTLIALCVIVVMEVRSGIPSADNLKAAPDGDRKSVTTGPVRLTLPPLAALSETLERPLFSEARQPPEVESGGAPVATAAVATGPAGNFSVSAIVISGDERAVLISHPPGGGLTRVAEGETVAGWRLDRVENDRAVFTRDGETREAVLRTFGPPPPRRVQRQAPAQPGANAADRTPRRTLNRTLDRTRLLSPEPENEPGTER